MNKAEVQKAGTVIRSWRENPAKFVADNFKITPDAWQVETLEKLGGSLTPRRRLAMKACTGPGKSAVLAWIGWHRLMCFGEIGEHPKGAAISGEGRENLRDGLWSELSKWQQRSEILKRCFVMGGERIYAKDHPDTWFLSARSYAKDANSDAIGRSLSGLHSKYPFILLDETGDMPLTVGQKAEQIFTGGPADGLIAAAGNPTSTSGLLYHIASTERAVWDVVTITADPDDAKRTPRVDIEHARQKIQAYGRENAWIMATILGQFPKQGFNALMSLDDVEAAMGRHLTSDQYDFAQKRLGVDVARFGDDRTVIFPRQGLAAFTPVEMRAARTPEIAARVAAAKAKWGSEMEMVDGTGGFGAGVIDSLLQGGHSPLEVSFSGKSIDPRYFNKRSEMWFEMAAWVKRGGALPHIPDLVRELTEIKFYYQGGKFRLEEKEQVKDRLGFSPDLADALALTFALPDMPRNDTFEARVRNQQKSKLQYEYDPFSDEPVAVAR